MRASTSWLLAFLLLSPLFAANLTGEFELRHSEISITLYPDGTAHAVESMRIFMNNTQSIKLYEDTMQSNDLATWVGRTGISDLRTHITSTSVEVGNLQVRSKSPDNCNSLLGVCFATLVLEYDIRPLYADKPGILKLDNYKPRTTRYTFISDVLLLPRSSSGDILLSPNAVLRIILPSDASDIKFSQLPDNLQNETSRFIYDPSQGYNGGERQFVWTDQTLSKFSLNFQVEAPLESEILSYFSHLQTWVFQSAFSIEGIAFILVVLVLLVSILWIHHLRLS